MFGDGVEKNEQQAVQWIAEVAEKGNFEAQHNLALMYVNSTGVSKDLETAAAWQLKADTQGFPNAQFELGDIYLSGQDVAQNEEEAISGFKRRQTEASKRQRRLFDVCEKQKKQQSNEICFENS